MRPAFVLAPLLAALAGCGVPANEEDLVDDAVDSVESFQGNGALLASSTEAVPAMITADAAANAAAAALEAAQASPKPVYEPADCVTVETTGATNVYALDDCTGRYGFLRFAGEVEVRYAIGVDGLHTHALATDLHVNEAVIHELNAEGAYAIDADGTKRLAVQSRSRGEGPRGEFSRRGTFALAWRTDGCVTFDGAWQGKRGDVVRETTIDGWSKCGAKCPAAGGVIRHEDAALGLDVTIRFDGSRKAKWEASSGRTGTVALTCVP